MWKFKLWMFVQALKMQLKSLTLKIILKKVIYHRQDSTFIAFTCWSAINLLLDKFTTLTFIPTITEELNFCLNYIHLLFTDEISWMWKKTTITLWIVSVNKLTLKKCQLNWSWVLYGTVDRPFIVLLTPNCYFDWFKFFIIKYFINKLLIYIRF